MAETHQQMQPSEQQFEQLPANLQWIPGTPRTVPFTVEELTLRAESAIIQLGAITQGMAEIGIPTALAAALRDLHSTYESLSRVESAIVRTRLTEKE